MGARILSVDDSRVIHKVIARTLRGYEVIHIIAFNGRDGVNLAKKEKPDLILLDVTMPGLNGLDALACLKDDPETAPIPVIMLTAEGNADSKNFAFGKGVEKYVTKPFATATLLAAIGSLVSLRAKAG